MQVGLRDCLISTVNKKIDKFWFGVHDLKKKNAESFVGQNVDWGR